MTREQALACIPVHNNVISWEKDEENLITIHYTLPLKPLFYSIYKRFIPDKTSEPIRKLQLDELGSKVWAMIDGKQTTADIIKSFSGDQNISLQDGEQAVTMFFRELGKRGLIGLK